MQVQMEPNDSSITWAVDDLGVIAHGWAYTHLDAIAHAAYRGRMYNGYGTDNMKGPAVRRLGIQHMRTGITGRAVLFDMPRLLGVAYLGSGTAITAEHLERWERAQRLRVEPGDIVLIRTGRWAREQAEPTWDARSAGGPHPSVALWLKERGASALGGDLANELYPSIVP
jgi:kynurenine formamidase